MPNLKKYFKDFDLFYLYYIRITLKTCSGGQDLQSFHGTDSRSYHDGPLNS